MFDISKKLGTPEYSGVPSLLLMQGCLIDRPPECHTDARKMQTRFCNRHQTVRAHRV